MSLLQNLLKYFKDQLKATAVFTSVPLSLLLFGLEALIDVQFSCPCSTWWNALLSALMFIAPPCFVFMLMFLLTRPLKNTSICCCLGCMICIGTRQDKVKKFQTVLLCFKSLLHCLIPPVVWVMLLFYDGDYLACGVTEWNGVYVYDDELHTKWCKPTGKNANRETQLRDVTLDYIVLSKIISYVLLIVFSIATVCVVIVYDICGCEKSTCCRDSEQESLEEGIELSTEA